MDIQPVKRINISEQVFNQLEQKIIQGEWAQGEKLPSENELAESFQVSRVTIRHAIHKLAALGLAETRLGEGTFIKSLRPGILMQNIIPVAYLSPLDIREVLDFRYILEIETAGMAVERSTPEDVDVLRRNLQAMIDSQGDAELFSESDLAFHMSIANITRNSLIIETYGILQDVLKACMDKTVESLGMEIGVPYHKRLIQAFEAKDSGAAKEIMRSHMDSTRVGYEKLLENGAEKQV